MDTLEISAEPRSRLGKGGARKLRRAGRVPAVIYGPGRDTTHVTVSTVEFERKVASLEGAHLIRIRGDAAVGEAVVLLRELQEHPVSGEVLHADFLEVDLTKPIQVTVSLHFSGRAVGIVAGGVLQPILREIEVECLPTQIPDYIDVDVTPLEIHGSLHVQDLSLPSGVTAVSDGTLTVVTVAAPVAEAPAAAEEPAAGEAPAAAPPEGGESTSS